ncbi:IS110 family transposase, partial [Paenibacillus rhizoplanae]
LQDWLSEHGCLEVVMESTGVFWKPVWNILEGSCDLVLANAQRVKNMPGRKSDMQDARWLAQLHRCGLIEGSMVPEQDIRDLRDLTRYRSKMVQAVTAEKNRIHKILQDANIKLTTFMSDLYGVSGRGLLQKIMYGEVVDEVAVKSLVKTRLKKKVPQLLGRAQWQVAPSSSGDDSRPLGPLGLFGETDHGAGSSNRGESRTVSGDD